MTRKGLSGEKASALMRARAFATGRNLAEVTVGILES
jgi:hypothetical protein